jgi:hypothetical protein
MFHTVSQNQATMILQVKLTARSSNRKTGPIATTMTSSDSCPSTCPFNNGNGCYAAGGPTAIHWRKLDRREIGTSIGDFGHQLADAKLAPGSLLRWNVAGDLPHIGGTINLPVVQQLVGTMVWGAKLRPFTYTHHVQSADNLDAVRWCNGSGFTVNLSCDTEAQASRRHRDGFAAVCVVASDDARKSWQDEHGVRFQTCPAQLKDGVTCQTCKLCTKADRACVVAFRAHGASRKRVDLKVASFAS